ncbi:MAG TPA: TonB-dependent receptor [Vicinamibacterales bacterium]|nr:TonB-dependent receptor [Vicinamibacterales bacterium]
MIAQQVVPLAPLVRASREALDELARVEPVREEITVSATRTDRRLEDEPVRVEVLDRDEIEEKMLMTPSDIVMMLNEMGGMRVQATSPSLGAASVRIQGMPGRYTRVLSDGLPLYGEQVGALGLLQIPPMDLGQVEVIKGVASSLYGAGAMGGVINLVSRRPAPETQRELLVNRSMRGATDIVAWQSGPLRGRWGLTLLGSGHWQARNDVDGDDWADLPSYARAVLRPRLFYDSGGGRTLFATLGLTVEERDGGAAFHEETLGTRRIDAGMSVQTLWRRFVLTARSAFAQQRHRHVFGDALERDRHDTAFGELAIRGTAGRHTWVAGAAVERDAYRPRDLPVFEHAFVVPGMFAQDDFSLARWLAISGSVRADAHSEYGGFLSPRVSVLIRAGRWSSRVSAGIGFLGPSALTEETEATGLTRLRIPVPLRAERGRSASFDLTRTDGPLSYTLTLFGSRVASPVTIRRASGLTLVNAAEPSSTVGMELLGTLRREPFAVTASYTFVEARRFEETGYQDAPLTPRHSAGLVGMWEREDVGRFGLEWYYTGKQPLEENPYRERSVPYVIVGLLGEWQLGRLRLFVNGENLTGVRQTRWDSLLRPTRAADGRWTVDAWAPLEGRNVNAGVRLRF